MYVNIHSGKWFEIVYFKFFQVCSYKSTCFGVFNFNVGVFIYNVTLWCISEDHSLLLMVCSHYFIQPIWRMLTLGESVLYLMWSFDAFLEMNDMIMFYRIRKTECLLLKVHFLMNGFLRMNIYYVNHRWISEDECIYHVFMIKVLTFLVFEIVYLRCFGKKLQIVHLKWCKEVQITRSMLVC